MRILAAALLALATGPVAAAGHGAITTHEAEIIGASGDPIGTVMLTRGREGVLIDVTVSSLPPGTHGLHFHQVADCSDIGKFKHSGGHVNPGDEPHGLLHEDGPHEGDLPNLIVPESGSVTAQFYTGLIQWAGDNGDKGAIFDRDGSAIVIHESADDHRTQPIGGAGARIACAVLKDH